MPTTTSTRKLRTISCDIGLRFEASWLDCVTMMSEMTIAVIVVSASCHHLTRADSGWSRISWFSRVTLPWLRGGTSVAPRRHKSSHVPVFRRLFDRLPVRFSTSDLHHRILRNKLYHIRAYDFGVQFSFKEVRCSFYEFSKPIRFCSNLVETFFNPFPIRKCKKKLGVTMFVFKMALIKVPLIIRAISLRFFLLTLLGGRQWTSECAQTSGQTLSWCQKWFWELFCSRHCFTGKNSQYHIWLSGAQWSYLS